MGKRAGKIILGSMIALLCIPVLLLILAVFLSPMIDDMALSGYRDDILQSLALPENAAVVETVSGCGNSSGTGNHLEMVVGVLVRSDLDADEFTALFPDAFPVWEQDFSTEAMRLLGLNLPKMEEAGRYYYLEYIASAPCSALDLRGH